MSRITATCNTDGLVKLRSKQVKVVEYIAEDGSTSALKFCFKCPVCAEIQTKDLTEHYAEVLTYSGSERFRIEPITAESNIPSSGKPLDIDDIIEALRSDHVSEPALFREIRSHLNRQVIS